MNSSISLDKYYDLYLAFTAYYGNARFIKAKQENQLGMYIAKIKTQLLGQYRYLFAFVLYDDSTPIGTIKNLSELRWTNFQTRTLETDTYYMYPFVNIPMNNNLQNDIIRVSEQEKYTEYKCDDFPIKIYLLNTKRVYQQKAKLLHALETYQTIIERV